MEVEPVLRTVIHREEDMDTDARTQLIKYQNDVALQQPEYEDAYLLEEARREARNTAPSTTFENIDRLNWALEKIALSDGLKFNIVGRCDWPVDLRTTISERVGERLAIDGVMDQETGPDTLTAQRDDNQCVKPRSNLVPGVYRGGMVNGESEDDRDHDPSRMVAARIQARDVERELRGRKGSHVAAAHEALHLMYEEDHAYEHRGKIYIESGDLLWVGDRTRNLDGKHLELLSQIENPVGIKIGGSTTADDIRHYNEILNPDRRPGKVTFMLRFDVNNKEKADEILEAIAEFAPESLRLADIHGVKKEQPDGTKTRLVSDIVDYVGEMAEACRRNGIRLHGMHLEAMGRDDIKECIDKPGEKPSHTSLMDPNLNLSQLRRIMRETRQYL